MAQVRAISILQPWCQLIAAGAKMIETREKRWNYVGPIALHASKAFAPHQRDFCQRAEVAAALMGGSRSFYFEEVQAKIRDMPLGCIVAIATLAGCVEVSYAHPGPPLNSLEHLFGNYAMGRGMLWLRNVRPLATPYPASGQLGLWTVEIPPAVLANLLPPVPYFGDKCLAELPG